MTSLSPHPPAVRLQDDRATECEAWAIVSKGPNAHIVADYTRTTRRDAEANLHALEGRVGVGALRIIRVRITEITGDDDGR